MKKNNQTINPFHVDREKRREAIANGKWIYRNCVHKSKKHPNRTQRKLSDLREISDNSDY